MITSSNDKLVTRQQDWILILDILLIIFNTSRKLHKGPTWFKSRKTTWKCSLDKENHMEMFSIWPNRQGKPHEIFSIWPNRVMDVIYCIWKSLLFSLIFGTSVTKLLVHDCHSDDVHFWLDLTCRFLLHCINASSLHCPTWPAAFALKAIIICTSLMKPGALVNPKETRSFHL